jgi:hypothetical protein
MEAKPQRHGVDESLIRQQLELSPTERVRGLEAMYAEARTLALAGSRSRGERAPLDHDAVTVVSPAYFDQLVAALDELPDPSAALTRAAERARHVTNPEGVG